MIRFSMKFILISVFISIVTYSIKGIDTKQGKIHDPLNIFCGSISCYDILDVDRSSPLKDIKKAYRKLSLIHHPDKSKEANATEVFRLISKAYEVLEKNESRSLFDYYLDHPKDYFKVSGTHYYRNLPKSDNSKYQRVAKYLYTATINNLTEKQGGSRQTIELYQRAVEEYDKTINKGKKDEDKISISKNKLSKDPVFEKIVKKIVGEVKIEGGYRKPKWSETLSIQLFFLPWTIYKWIKKYYRRNISTVPFTEQEKMELTIEIVGLGLWEEQLNEMEKKKLIALELWKPSVREQWDELGLDILLEPNELAELRATRAAEMNGNYSMNHNGNSSISNSSNTINSSLARRKKILKKPKKSE